MKTDNIQQTVQETLNGLDVNVSRKERIASAVAGAGLVAYGLSRRSLGGVLLALAGGALAARGATGHCPGNEALGRNTADGEDASRRAIEVEDSVTVNRPRAEVFAFWRNFENPMLFMDHLESVTVQDSRNSRWVAKAPLGFRVAWDAIITDETENEMIAWRSLPESDIYTTGVVRFQDEGESTRVEVALQYDPPGGELGAAVARLFGEEPSQQVKDDLQKFKEIMEVEFKESL